MKSRIQLLDAMRGIAIVSVVLGHTILRDITNAREEWYLVYIYTFHMALFMFLGGYLSQGKMGFGWLFKRAWMLLVPFFVWQAIRYYSWIDFDGTLWENLWKAAKYPQNGLWFLYLLFTCSLVLFVCRGKWWLMLIALILINQVDAPHFQYVGIRATAWWFIFVGAGYLVAKHKDWFVGDTKWLFRIGLVVYPILFALTWDYNELKFPAFTNGDMMFSTYRMIMAFLGILWAFSLAHVLLKIKYFGRLTCWLGTLTLGIYVSHWVFIKFGFGDGYVSALSAAFMSLFGSAIMVYLISKIPVARNILLGSTKTI